ncbi:radical SAM protein [Anaerocolumna sp. AGMB13020]|uniref:radical SAM protein n=1 Tax=Anaerocolumna sp. AGMB13020 TaxID=3081750 RepID=UPI002955968A|nr:radical SAM protein [Anaerocolumna sp. AGMB13020]WOO36836.1 radical SAM protein [Anaerocolumna sp. AGMB13020]
MNKKMLNLHLYTNTNCNLHCRHCYNNSFYEENSAEIEVEQLVNIIRESHSAYKVDIHLEGGEIFLRPEVFEALASLEVEILNNITITSNGSIYLETPEVEYVLKNIEAFRISVEGHTNELNRMIRDIDVDIILGNAERYRDMGANVILRITLHRDNIHTLFRETIPAIADRGFHNFQVYELQPVGRGEKLENFILSENEFDSFLNLLVVEKPKDVKIKMMFSPSRVEGVMKRKADFSQAGYSTTLMEPAMSLSIATNGNVNICPWGTDDKVLFNINQEKDLCSALDKFDLMHECSYCSKIKIETE